MAGVYEEAKYLYDQERPSRVMMIYSAFTICNEEGQGRKGRFFVNLKHQINTW